MSLYDDLYSQFRRILIDACSPEYGDYPVIRSHQSGDELKSTYAVVNILSLPKTGSAMTSTLASTTDDVAYSLRVMIPYQALVQYTFVGPDAGSMALHAHMRMTNSPVNREYAQSFNLSQLNITDIRRLPQKRETTWCDQHTFDVTYSMILSFDKDVDIIKTIEYLDPFNDELISVPPQ